MKPKTRREALHELVVDLSEEYAKKHWLRYKRFDCTLRRKGFTGLCDWDGTITYQLAGKEPYQILDVIAHELAHLAFFDHNEKWMRLYAELVCDMLKDGVLQRIKEVCPVLPE